MKKLFPEFYEKNKSEFKHLWENAIFVFDTNVLLNLYRYSNSTRDDWVEVLTHLSTRTHLPYQIALEYQRNRMSVILSEERKNEKIQAELSAKINDFIKELKGTLNTSYRFFEHKDDLENVFDPFLAKIDTTIQGHPDLRDEDSIRLFLDENFSDKIGEKLKLKELEQIYKEGAERYKEKVPPGYKDDDKESPDRKFGDLIIWKSLISFAKSEQKSVIFVLDDKKEDWWSISKGRRLGPRVELLKEFITETKMMYHQYTADNFLDYSRQYIEENIKESSINETKEVSEIAERSKEKKRIDEKEKYVKQLALQKIIEENNKYREQLAEILSNSTSNQLADLAERVNSPWVDIAKTINTTPMSNISSNMNNRWAELARNLKTNPLSEVTKNIESPWVQIAKSINTSPMADISKNLNKLWVDETTSSDIDDSTSTKKDQTEKDDREDDDVE